MPVILSYPGVYVEEIPSGQFTITGVATSITAFVGRTLCGPTDLPVTLFNFGDYEREFGGLAYDFPLSYAVQDFFMNGGGQAVVGRLFASNTDLSRADWESRGATMLTTMKAALNAVPPNTGSATPAAFDAAARIKAANDAATALTGDDQSMAQAIMQNLPAAVSAAGTTDDFAAAVGAMTVPSYPSVLASLQLNSSAGAALAAPALGVASAVIEAAFDASGNTFNASAPVQKLQDAAAASALSHQENPDMKIARSVQKSVNGATAAKAIDATLIAAGAAIQAAAGNAPLSGLDDFNTLLGRIGQAIDKLATPATVPGTTGGTPATPTPTPTPAPAPDPDHSSTTPTPAVPATPPAAPTAQDGAKNISDAISTPALTGTALDAGAQVIAAVAAAAKAAGATIVSVIQAALTAAGEAAFAVPSAQIVQLVGADAGFWGNGLRAVIDQDNITIQSAKRFAKSGLGVADLFNLTVFYTRPNGTTDIERFTNLTVKSAADGKTPLPNRIDLVLKDQSNYVRVPLDANAKPILPDSAPAAATGVANGGDDGQHLQVENYLGDQSQKTGIYMLSHVDLFNLLCIPPDDRSGNTDIEVYQDAMAYCTDRRAILIVDPPTDWFHQYQQGNLDSIKPEDLHLFGTQTRNAAVYFPRVVKEDMMMHGQLDTFAACGAIAGVIASTDVQRGVWKAPAGQNAGLNNIYALEATLTDDEQGELNPLGINCLRNLPVLGPVVWGARTLRGADQLSDDFKYLSVRRLALFLEESLYRGTRWAVFEPNNEALWSSLRLAINAFMGDLARQGAFYGFKIKCDADTNLQSNIDKGIVTVLVQYAPVKPAEFVVLQFQQQAGVSPS